VAQRVAVAGWQWYRWKEEISAVRVVPNMCGMGQSGGGWVAPKHRAIKQSNNRLCIVIRQLEYRHKKVQASNRMWHQNDRLNLLYPAVPLPPSHCPFPIHKTGKRPLPPRHFLFFFLSFFSNRHNSGNTATATLYLVPFEPP
jgi:hypothetical protein